MTWTLTPTATGDAAHLSLAGFSDKDGFAYEDMGKGWCGPLGTRLASVLSA